MRHLHTIACAAALALSGQAGLANAQDTETQADRFTNRDLMAESEVGRRTWVNGVVVGVSHGVGLFDHDAGECIARWYFDNPDQAFASIMSNVERYPDHEPTIVVIALARRECSEFGASAR